MERFFFKGILCIFIVVVLQSFLARIFPPPYTPAVKKAQTIFHEKPDIILFGDSTIWVMHPKDIDRSSITTMLGNLMPSFRIRDLTDPAYDADMYFEYIRYMVRTTEKIPVIIIPINIRSFSPQWDLRPAFQYVDEKVSLQYADTILSPYLRFFFSFQAYKRQPISMEEFYQTPVYDGAEKEGIVKNYEMIKDQPYSDENMKKLLVYFYMFELTSTHRKYKSLEAFADFLREHDIRVLFYLTPVDWETGVSFLGERLKDRIAKNTGLVRSMLERKGFQVLDLTFRVAPEDFGWRDSEFIYINEHLNEKGRMYVAQMIKEALNDQFFMSDGQ